MKRVDELLGDYADHHRTRGNVICHFFGIPLIVFGILSLLRLVPIRALGEIPVLGVVTAAEVLIVLTFLYYATLDAPLAFAMLAVTSGLDALARLTPDTWVVGFVAFVVGWIFQGIGHARYEKRSPAFLRNFVHLLVGPVFLVNEVLHLRPVAHSPEAQGA